MARQFLWEIRALKNAGSLESHAHVQGKTSTQRKPEKTTNSSLGSAQTGSKERLVNSLLKYQTAPAQR